jgi:abortive infection bacteriophage resistance protein
MTTIYNKPFLDENKLLPINNENNAKKILKDITYYRFKIYAHPFKNNYTKEFDGSKSFEDIETLY